MEKTSIDKNAQAEVQSSESDVDLSGLEWTEEEETILRRKMDLRTVPWIAVLYLLCFLDRINIGNARIQGLERDLELYGTRFNWTLSIFFIFYLLVEVPSNIILKRVGARFYLPSLVVGFGFVSLCTAFVTSYAGLLAARAVLGMFEGGAMPGMAFYLSTFYKRKELLVRISMYVSAASLAGAFGGLFATALSRIPEWGTAAMPIHTWRNIFFFEGLMTMILGFMAPIWLPSSPTSCTFLTEREKQIAAERLAREHQAQPGENVTWEHVKKAVFCIHNYTCALGFFLINLTVQGVSSFLPTILRDLNWTSTQAQLYSVPPYVVACFVVVAIAYISDKTNRRGIYIAASALVAVTGFAILRWETTPNIRYMAVFFICIGSFPPGPGFLVWALNNSAGPAVRAVSSGYVVTLGTIGGIVATWSYTSSDAPAYHIGHSTNFGAQIAVFFLAIFGIAYCNYENKARAAGKRDHRLVGLDDAQQASLGSRHPEFRYIA